MSRKLISFTE